jgi:hypothetical protein
MDCDGAAATLSRPEVEKIHDGSDLLEIAHGCQRVTASLAHSDDDALAIHIAWQDEHDAVLASLVFETVSRARDVLSQDLGVDWPRPTRIVVVRDLLSLSAMTGLPYASARTTGTVAVAKWGRVTLLSPRASAHGFEWRDTIAHELTHLAVTRASRDRAPLWLQEGMAKREEVRWRAPGPFDDRPAAEAIVRRGLESGLALPLDKMGPSIAMLPSADAAMVAFAEVTSFVRFYALTQGNGALPKLLHELKSGKDASGALVAASGVDLRSWDERWRAYVAAQPSDAEGLPVGLLGVKSERRIAPAEVHFWREWRDRSRLAELLASRGHAVAALAQLDGLKQLAIDSPPDSRRRLIGDPALRWLQARVLERAGRNLAEEGEPLLGDPKEVLSPFGRWWAVRGRWARLRGNEALAEGSFAEALGADPLDPEVACETVDEASFPVEPHRRPLCDAAWAWARPTFDAD